MNLNMVFVLHFLAIFTLSTANRCLFNTPTYDFTVGKIGATIISDGPIEIQTNRFLVPKQAVEKSYEALFRSSSPLQWASNIVLLDTPAGRILVDTGAFNTPQFAFSQRSGQLRRNLEAAGVSRGSIAGIFITHGHPDHVAGLVTRAGKRAFKNARLYISRQEHEFWMNVPPVSENDTSQDAEASFGETYRRSVEPYAQNLQLVEEGDEPIRGIKVSISPGHTPGHLVVTVTSQGERLAIVGDTFLTRADQIQNPEWQFNLENNSTLAFESRLKLMHNLADKKTLTVAFHETFPGLGYVTKKGYTFDWVPAPNNNIASGVGKKCASFSRDSVFDM